MRVNRLIGALAAAALAAAMLGGVGAARAQDGGVIRGTVFVDLNANLVRDAGEPGYVGAEIIIANGQIGWPILTEGDGAFRADVPNGTWQVALMVPQGYAPANDANRQVTIGPESALDVVLEFALLSQSAPIVALDGAEPTATTPVVLPQTGSAAPPAAILALVLLGMLAAGLALLGLGRWASAR